MRRKERTVLRGVLLVSCIALVGWLLQPTAWSTRGCGVCSRQIVRMCDESGCGPFPACHGSCECEEWDGSGRIVKVMAWIAEACNRSL